MKKWGNLIPFREGNLWGFSNYNNEIVVSPIFDGLIRRYKDWFIVKKGKYYGVIDENGNYIIALGEFTRLTFSFLGVMKKGKEFEETLLVVNGEEQKFQIEDLIYDLRKKNNWFTNYFSAFNVGEIIHNRKFKTVFLLLKEDNSRNFYLVDDSGEFIDPLFLGNDRKETLGVLFSLFSYWNYVPSINKKYGLVSFDGDILVPFLYDKIKSNYSGTLFTDQYSSIWSLVALCGVLMRICM